MSKYVKNLITEHLRERFKDVGDALLVNMVGLDANADNRLRAELGQKNIQVMVVKNSLARRATEGTPLAAMFEGLTGSSAVCWGAEDLVSVAKEITRLARDEQYEAFRARGGVMDGEKLTPEQVRQVSQWPGREEVLAQIVGLIAGPGAALAGLLGGPGSLLASQIGQLAEKEEKSEGQASGS
jgi:large subunit ribosomal protein L10